MVTTARFQSFVEVSRGYSIKVSMLSPWDKVVLSGGNNYGSQSLRTYSCQSKKGTGLARPAKQAVRRLKPARDPHIGCLYNRLGSDPGWGGEREGGREEH